MAGLAVAGLAVLFGVGWLVVRRALTSAQRRHYELQESVKAFRDALEAEHQAVLDHEEQLRELRSFLEDEAEQFISELEGYRSLAVEEAAKVEDIETKADLIKRLLEARDGRASESTIENPDTRPVLPPSAQQREVLLQQQTRAVGQPARRWKRAAKPPTTIVVGAMKRAAIEIAHSVTARTGVDPSSHSWPAVEAVPYKSRWLYELHELTEVYTDDPAETVTHDPASRPKRHAARSQGEEGTEASTFGFLWPASQRDP